MFCHKCGTEIIEGAAFCPKCGTKVMRIDDTRQPASTAKPTAEPRQDSAEKPMVDVKIMDLNLIHKINAIQVIKDATGWSLSEAKDFVENVINGDGPPATIRIPSENAKDFVSACLEVGVIARMPFEEKGPVHEGEKFIPSVSPDEIQGLNREQTLEVLRQVKSIAEEQEEYESGISSLLSLIRVQTKKADDIREEISTAAALSVFALAIVAALIGLGVGGIILAAVFGIIMFFIASKIIETIDEKRHAVENNQKADQYMAEHVLPLQAQLEEIEDKRDILSQSGKLQWAVDVVSEDLFYSECIADLYDLIKSRRADNLKEAMNKYDDELYKRRMEEMQSAIKNASEVAAAESVKQTARMKSIDKNTRQTATAAKITAATSYGTYRNTKKIRKKLK